MKNGKNLVPAQYKSKHKGNHSKSKTEPRPNRELNDSDKLKKSSVKDYTLRGAREKVTRDSSNPDQVQPNKANKLELQASIHPQFSNINPKKTIQSTSTHL